MTEQQMREEFEDWANDEGLDLSCDFFSDEINHYENKHVRFAFDVWQAAKEQSNKDIEELKAQRDFYEERCTEQSKELTESANRLELVRKERDAEIIRNSSDWISVKDKLPEFEEKVLFCTNFNEEMFIGYRSSNRSGFLLSGCEELEYIYPTHWQPLPATPDE